MSFRARVAFIAAAAVAVAVIAASVGIYLAAANVLRGEVDDSLREMAAEVDRAVRERRPIFGPRPGRLGGPGGFIQVIDARGNVADAVGATEPLPVTEQARQVARGGEARFETLDVDGQPVRVLTLPAVRGLALQIARPLTEVEGSLDQLRARLVVGSLVGIALAAALGTIVARRAVRPVEQLTDLAENVAATQDLSRRIEVQSEDEIGRLATTFNRMLAELEQARDSQRQLVADASHELRTPLTSLRTNIEVLADADRLPVQDRRELIEDVVTQLDEFGRLIAGLVELARGDRPVTAPTEVRLDELVIDVVERTRTFAGGEVAVVLTAAPTTVTGESDRIERAVANLLDNAIKYGGGRPIDVTVGDGAVSVRDRGSGIDPADLPYVFDRFYRAPASRGEPGSGLGLSIVQQVAESHGASVEVEAPPDGGTRLTVRFPTR
ncbi:MAG: HAMP domain-containing histidine kinase [Actinobacteria bacterium]|nr:HAMP domain-containing histidine kinase [Actinomycetota bacterium]